MQGTDMDGRGSGRGPVSEIPQDLTAFPFEQGLVVVRRGVNCLFLLNPTGRFLWECLRKGQSRQGAAESLTEAYGIPLDRAADDVAKAIADWRARGLLGERAPEPDDSGGAAAEPPGETPATPAFARERRYVFLDKQFRIRFEDHELEAAIHPRYANLEFPEAGPVARTFEVFRAGSDCVLRQEGADTETARNRSPGALGCRLFREIVELGHPDLDLLAWLHGGTVGDGERTVLLVGKGGSGKSTLTAAAAYSGLACYGDDRVLLDYPSGLAVATPNAVILKQGSWPVLSSRFPEIAGLPTVRIEEEALRFLPMAPPARRLLPRVVSMAFLQFDARGVTAMNRITATEALRWITHCETWVASDPERVRAFLQWVQATVAYRLSFSSLDRAVDLLRGALEQ
ncbi:PqqD family peptide modification chaperone [Verrucomicrobiota bacterium]